jgi:MFS family permease
VGDGIRVTALPLLAASMTRDPLAVAVVGGAVWLPWLLFGPLGGAIVDRVDRRALMTKVQLARTLLLAALAIAVLAELESIALLVVVALLVGAGEVLVDSALYSLVPRIVSEGKLEAANGRLGAAQLVGNELAGPPIGGLLFGLSMWGPFVVDAASFATSGALLQGINGDFTPRSEGSVTTSVWQDAKVGLRWLAGHDVLRATAAGLGVINIASGSWAILVLFSLEILDLTGVGFGLLVSATAVGGVAGSFLGERGARTIGRGRGMLCRWPWSYWRPRGRALLGRAGCGSFDARRGPRARDLQRHRSLAAPGSHPRPADGTSDQRLSDVELRHGRGGSGRGGFACGCFRPEGPVRGGRVCGSDRVRLDGSVSKRANDR